MTNTERSFTAVEVPVLSKTIRDLGVPLSLVTVADGMIFVSGCPPFDCETGEIVEGDIATQTKASIATLRACLNAAGSSLENVVSVRIYVANAGHYETINKVYCEYFWEPFPSRTVVPVGSWWRGFDLEIECVAVAASTQT